MARALVQATMRHSDPSVVLFGRCRRLVDAGKKRHALDAFFEHLIPGRTGVARPMTESEVAATEVLALRIEEATAKVRQGPPKEPAEDRKFPAWAGVLPLVTTIGEPLGAPDLSPGLAPPTLP